MKNNSLRNLRSTHERRWFSPALLRWNSSSVCVWVTDFSLEWFWQLENRREIVFRAELRSGIEYKLEGITSYTKKLLFGVCRHIWLQKKNFERDLPH